MANKLIKIQGSSYRTLYASNYLAGLANGAGTTVVDPIAGSVYAITGDVPVTIPQEIHGQDPAGAICVRLVDPDNYADPYTSLDHTAEINQDGDVTITPAGGLTEYAVLIASVETQQPTEAQQQAGKALGWPLLVGMSPVTTTDTQPTFGGLYNSTDYADFAVTIDGTTYIDSESPAGLTVSGGAWSLNMATAGQTLSVGTYRVSIAQVGAGGTSYVTTSTVTVEAADLRARYNSGTELHDGTGHIARDGSDQYTGVDVQDHVSQGDTLGLPGWYDAQNGEVVHCLEGTPYTSQNDGLDASALGTKDFCRYVIPDDIGGGAFTILLGPCSLASSDDLLVRTDVGGFILRKIAGSNNLVCLLRDRNDKTVVDPGTTFHGTTEVSYFIVSWDPSTPRLYMVATETYTGSDNRVLSTTTVTGTPYITTSHIVFGGALRQPVIGSGDGTKLVMRIYKGLAISDPTSARELWDPTEPGYDRTGGGTLWKDFTGVRHGCEMAASPSDPYPVRSGYGTYPTAESEV